MKGLDKLPALLAAADWPGAERILKRAAQARGADPSVYYNLGRVLIEQGKWSAALVWLRRAVAARADYVLAWFELGRAAVETRDLELAFKAFQKALALDASDVDARRNLGRVALRLGRYDEARSAWASLAGECEADVALYRVAAEQSLGDVEARRIALRERHGRAVYLRAIVRVSRGHIPMQL